MHIGVDGGLVLVSHLYMYQIVWAVRMLWPCLPLSLRCVAKLPHTSEYSRRESCLARFPKVIP